MAVNQDSKPVQRIGVYCFGVRALVCLVGLSEPADRQVGRNS